MNLEAEDIQVKYNYFMMNKYMNYMRRIWKIKLKEIKR